MHNTGRNLIFSLMNVGISAIQSLWLLSYVQRIMGIEAYGYIALIMAVVNVTSIFTLAFTSFSSRFIVVNVHKQEYKRANEYYNSVFFGLLIVSIVIGIVIFFLSLDIGLWLKVDPDYADQVRLLLYLVIGSFLINTISTPLKSSVFYSNKLYIMYSLQIGSYLARIVFAIILYNLFSPQIWYAYLGSFVFDIFSFFLYFYMIKHEIPELCVKCSLFSLNSAKEILSSGIWVSINKVGAALFTSVNTYLIGIMVSVYMTGIYSTVTQFVTFVGVLVTTVVTSIVPILYKLYAMNEIEKLREVILFSSKLLSVFLGFVIGEMIIYEKYLLAIMINDEYLNYTILIVITLLVIPFTYPASILEQTLITYNKFTLPSIIQLVFGGINVFLILITYKLGFTNIYCIIAITELMGLMRNVLFLPAYTKIVNGIALSSYYMQLLRGGIGMFLSVSCCYIISRFIIPNGLLQFVISVTLSGAILLIFVWKSMFDKIEREQICGLIERRRMK